MVDDRLHFSRVGARRLAGYNVVADEKVQHRTSEPNLQHG
jgi:hypothetical protein